MMCTSAGWSPRCLTANPVSSGCGVCRGASDEAAAFAAGLPGPVRATYEAGPTGFVLARKLAAVGVDCLVCAPELIPRGATDRVKTDRRDAERMVRLLAAG